MGFALVLTPVLFAFLPPAGAILTVTALGLALSLLILLAERRRPHLACAQIAPILAAAVPGTICGVLLLRAVPKPALQVGVGVAVIAATLLHVRASRVVAGQGRMLSRLAVGLLTGALTTSAGISGPPLALWLSRRGLTAAELRDTLSVMFLGIGAIASLALVPVLRHAQLDPPLLGVALGCVLAGHALGSRMFARLTRAASAAAARRDPHRRRSQRRSRRQSAVNPHLSTSLPHIRPGHTPTRNSRCAISPSTGTT